MRQRPVYVVDIISDIVAAIQPKVSVPTINYVPGTEGEINEVLTQMSQQPSKDDKQWPLFALLMSFREDKGAEIGIDSMVDLNIIIAMRSNNTDKTPARYTNTFKPILYPIYLEFLNQLYLSGKFSISTPDNIPHQKWDFPYYNADKETNVFNSYVDAIQIKIKLKIKVAASWKC